MYFYKKQNGKWQIGKVSLASGKCIESTDQVSGRITVKVLGENPGILAENKMPTDFKDEAGNYYADLAAYELATAGFFVDAALAAAEQLAIRVDYLEQHAYDTLWIDYWQAGQPTATAIGQVWFNTTDTIKAWNGTTWNTIPIDFYKLYVKASISPRETYTWSGSAMVAVSVPLTKPAVEALIYNGSIVPSALDINTASADVFVKTLTGATSFTISNPILYKPFRIILTGGSLNATLFTGYTTNWILTSLITDYVNTVSNVLWCEVRSAGQIYCFWGA